MAISIKPLTPPPGSKIDFGAVAENVDIENLTGMTEIWLIRGMGS